MKKGHSYKDYNSGEPLCVFDLSPPFSIRGSSGEKRQSAPSRRQQLLYSRSSFTGLQSGRFNRKKSYTNLLLTIADLFRNFKKRKSLNLEEILSTIQEAWKGADTLTFCDPDVHMEMISKKLSIQEGCLPNPQRRRLSVPETIMRKHILAQEHSVSQESKYYHWSKDTQCSSDPNLSRKKDFNLMRKSTLLRRLWGDNNKPKLLSGSFREWQHSYKKGSSMHSLDSNHSSPEHLPKSTMSPRRKLTSSPNRFSTKRTDDNDSATNSPQRKMPVVDNTSLRSLTRTPLSRESNTKYTFSSFTNFSDTNSDSAYTNSISNLTNGINSTYRNNPDEDQTTSEADDSRLSRVSLRETAVQTRDVANLNVISNVNLSQSTLDIIFKVVMKDATKLTPGEINISSAVVSCDDSKDVKVNKVPSVSLNTHSDCSRASSDRSNMEQFIISNVRTGSPYIKSTESAQTAVPRFSAVPRTSSMEVNTSEEDKEESDTTSFVDSLEDFSSPRVLPDSCRSSSDISQLLPEGKKYPSPKKSSTFYIPIEVASDKEVKAVSELLPVKVRERLAERQQKREEKCRQFKSVSALKISESVSEIKNNLTLRKYLPKKRTKPVLPSIESLKKSTNEKIVGPAKTNWASKKSSRLSKQSREQKNQNAAVPVYDIEPRKIYRKTSYENAQKQIEILEIMECIEIPSDRVQKSKIPIRTTNKRIHFDKPSCLDLDNYVPDQNLDQLIANLLIDSLNHEVDNSIDDSDKRNANLLEKENCGNDDRKYFQKFDPIPEETSVRQTKPEEKNNNNDTILSSTNENCTQSIKYKKSEKNEISSIPTGWVTVHTVHKDAETPESTSDEGKQYLDTRDVKDEVRRHSVNGADSASERENIISAKSDQSHSRSDSKPEIQNAGFLSSSNDETNIFESTLLNRPERKFRNYNIRSAKMKCQEAPKRTKGDWSVTIRGTNSYGQMAPDVEMKLKFPNKFVPNNQSYRESNPKEKKSPGKRYNFPKIENERNSQERQNKIRKQRSMDECLPNIQSAQNINRKTDADGSVIAVNPSIIIPRQTKTSRSRYHLSRPREGFSLPDIPSILNERQYYEILRRIPAILAVTGRSISSEGKSIEER